MSALSGASHAPSYLASPLASPISAREARRLPLALPGMRIGLMGGSFNPAHATHRAAALLAMRRLGLHSVWWLVTPGNPLKDNSNLPSLEERVACARKVAAHPRIIATGCEALWGMHYTHETLKHLHRHLPGVRFVWVMGADNLIQFNRWERWRDIAGLMPIAVVDRAGASAAALSAPAARALGRFRLPERMASQLADMKPPAWVFLHGLKSAESSTRIRARISQA